MVHIKLLGILEIESGKRNWVLFIGPTDIGDLLLTTPAIGLAKEDNPSLEIIYMTQPQANSLHSIILILTVLILLICLGFGKRRRALVIQFRAFANL